MLPPKMSFFLRQKVQISSKNLPQIPNFANYVYFVRNQYFRHDGQFRHFVSFSSKTKSFGAYIARDISGSTSLAIASYLLNC